MSATRHSYQAVIDVFQDRSPTKQLARLAETAMNHSHWFMAVDLFDSGEMAGQVRGLRIWFPGGGFVWQFRWGDLSVLGCTREESIRVRDGLADALESSRVWGFDLKPQLVALARDTRLCFHPGFDLSLAVSFFDSRQKNIEYSPSVLSKIHKILSDADTPALIETREPSSIDEPGWPTVDFMLADAANIAFLCDLASSLFTPALAKVYDASVVAAISAFVEIELGGVAVDVARLEAMSLEMRARIALAHYRIRGTPVYAEWIQRHVGTQERFKARRSPLLDLRRRTHRAELLHEILRLPVRSRTPTGEPSLTSETVVRLYHEIPPENAVARTVVNEIGACMEACGNLDRVISPIQAALVKSDGIGRGPFPHPARSRNTVCAEYVMDSSETFRVCASRPAIQGIPATPWFRRLFCSRWRDHGGLYFRADYSQMELVVLAVVSGDSVLLDLVRRGEDLHRSVASLLFNVPLDAVSDSQRKVSKMINFGIIYGASSRNLAASLGWEVSRFEAVRTQFYGRFEGVAAWMDRVRDQARRTSQVVTHIGVVRDLHGHTGGELDRRAINTSIQLTAAILSRKVLAQIHLGLRSRHLRSRLVLFQHDSFDVDVAPGELRAVLDVVRAAMVDSRRLEGWPFRADFSAGLSWGDLVSIISKSDVENGWVLRFDPRIAAHRELAQIVRQAHWHVEVEEVTRP